jgi:hypothetical protein
MKVLYIHGLDSHPTPQKVNMIAERGHEVFALHLNYRVEADAYPILKKYAIENQVEFIVGSSLGGFLGFYLAEELGLDCLLFNPAMGVSLAEAKISADFKRACNKRYVILGDKDEVVNPNLNWEFFQKPENQTPHQRVIRCQWLAHQIDLPSFKEFISLAGL